MTSTIPLGRIAGVRVGLHWSVAGILALLMAFSLARWPELTYSKCGVSPRMTAPTAITAS
jgi:hypothetical protein